MQVYILLKKNTTGFRLQLTKRSSHRKYHKKLNSAHEGTTRDDLYEVMNTALIVGGSIVIPHLRYAFEILDEILPKDDFSGAKK